MLSYTLAVKHGSMTTVYANTVSVRRSFIPEVKRQTDLLLSMSLCKLRADRTFFRSFFHTTAAIATGLSESSSLSRLFTQDTQETRIIRTNHLVNFLPRKIEKSSLPHLKTLVKRRFTQCRTRHVIKPIDLNVDFSRRRYASITTLGNTFPLMPRNHPAEKHEDFFLLPYFVSS